MSNSQETISIFGDSSVYYIPSDTVPEVVVDSSEIVSVVAKRTYDPKKAAMLSAAFPGLGQIYNRKYWKLPFVYGGFAGLGYGIYWNNKWYHNYQNYYSDLIDGNPTTNRYLDVVTQEQVDNYKGGNEELAKKFQQKKESYRRDRDFVIILTTGLYVLNILDASVDAHLSDFDIGKDISLKLKPQMQYMEISGQASLGLGCSLSF